MVIYVYDGTLEGFLTLLVQAYQHGIAPDHIVAAEGEQAELFGEATQVETDVSLAHRAAERLSQRAYPGIVRRLYQALLSRAPSVEMQLFYYLTLFLGMPDSQQSPTGAALSRAIRAAEVVEGLARQVGREVHRMHAFVRFEAQADGTYEAVIEPAFDVLPLLAEHFVTRYPALHWTIRDEGRGQSLIYDGKTACLVAATAGKKSALKEEERFVQALWCTYFEAVNIQERCRPELQQRHIPLRYRKHMTELRTLPDAGAQDRAGSTRPVASPKPMR